MTTVKIRLRASSLQRKEGSLYFSLVYRGKSAQVTTQYKLYSEEWDEFRQRIILTNMGRDRQLLFIQQRMDATRKILHNVIEYVETHTCGEYSVADVARLFRDKIKQKSFFAFFDEQIKEIRAERRFGTAGNYQCTRQSFSRFLKGRELSFQEITVELIKAYEQWLKANGIVRNTISFYMRTLRALCNKASEKYYFSPAALFDNVYTGVDKTRKRAMDEDVIMQILRLDLSCYPALQYARDIFLFSFYTRGMAYVDIAYLKKSDIRNGIIHYTRRKTGKLLFVRVEACMQVIIERYASLARHSEYVFPIIHRTEQNQAYKEYRNSLCYYNKLLKRLSEGLGYPSSYLSSYVARHSWATIARNRNVPLSVISAGMGHGSEVTTQIYLASLDTTIVDEANFNILSRFYLEMQ